MNIRELSWQSLVQLPASRSSYILMESNRSQAKVVLHVSGGNRGKLIKSLWNIASEWTQFPIKRKSAIAFTMILFSLRTTHLTFKLIFTPAGLHILMCFIDFHQKTERSTQARSVWSISRATWLHLNQFLSSPQPVFSFTLIFSKMPCSINRPEWNATQNAVRPDRQALEHRTH